MAQKLQHFNVILDSKNKKWTYELLRSDFADDAGSFVALVAIIGMM